MPSTKELAVSKSAIDAFRTAVKHNPAYNGLPRSFKTRFADCVLPHIDSQFRGNNGQIRRFVMGTVEMASNEQSLKNALETSSDAKHAKRVFKNYGVVIEHLRRTSAAEEETRAKASHLESAVQLD